MSTTLSDGLLTGSESETATSTTTTEDEDAVLGCVGAARLRHSKKSRETPFMFLEIPFEDQKVLFEAIRTQNIRLVLIKKFSIKIGVLHQFV